MAKKKNYYLITVKGDKRVNLKEFRKRNNTRPLSFASGEELGRILKLIPGAVTPLGILNDEERIVHFYIDREFLDEPALLGIHPNDNTATVWIRTVDLIGIVKEHGNPADITELPDGIRWAVGAMGLLDNYDPAAEGFSGAYADVRRKTNHTVLGVKTGMVHLVYCRNMTGQQVNEFCRDKMKLELAVMLDGGHVAAINGA